MTMTNTERRDKIEGELNQASLEYNNLKDKNGVYDHLTVRAERRMKYLERELEIATDYINENKDRSVGTTTYIGEQS